MAFGMSILGYLLEVLVAYVTTENREALPARTVGVLTAAGLGIQSLGLIAACLLMVAAFRNGSGDHRNWYLAGFGTAAALGAGFLIFRFQRRIKAWHAAWQRRPAAGEAKLD
jgi:heme/copper-type cytochrome/quinol oxidase subunit 3